MFTYEGDDIGGVVPDPLELDYAIEGELNTEFGGFPGDVGKFFKNASRSAGRAIGKVEKSITKASGDVSRKIGKIPIVGAPLKAVYDVTYHTMTAPVRMCVDVGVHHRRIDRVALGHLKETVADVKNVGQYAQTVVSLVPGVGSGVSAALGAGLAIANGKPIDKILIAAAAGIVPGGPIAAAAVTTGASLVRAAATGKKVDLASIGKMAADGVGAGLGLPPAATQAIGAGVSLAGNLAAGQKLDRALTSAVVEALPLDGKVKAGINEASQLALDLGHGKRVDKALLARVQGVAKLLPTEGLGKEVDAILKNTAKLPADKLQAALATTLHTGVANSLIDVGSKGLKKEAKKALQTGIALGVGMTAQSQQAGALGRAAGKLEQAGLDLAKAVPAMGAARALAKGGSKGFDLGAGITSSRASVFALQVARAKLSGPDKMGFDMALSARVGLVTQPMHSKASPAAQAGAAVTFGMRDQSATNKTALMKAVATNPSAVVGAKVAVKEIAQGRTGLIDRILKALGLIK